MDDEDIKLLAQEFIDIENLNLKTLYIKTSYNRYNELRRVLAKNTGDTPVVIYFEDKNKSVKLDEKLRFNINDESINILENFLGKGNVKFS